DAQMLDNDFLHSLECAAHAGVLSHHIVARWVDGWPLRPVKSSAPNTNEARNRRAATATAPTIHRRDACRARSISSLTLEMARRSRLLINRMEIPHCEPR